MPQVLRGVRQDTRGKLWCSEDAVRCWTDTGVKLPLRVREECGLRFSPVRVSEPIERAQELKGGLERAQVLLDRLREPLDLLVEEVEMGEDRADEQRVQRIEAALERLSDLPGGVPWARIGELVGHDDLVTTART